MTETQVTDRKLLKAAAKAAGMIPPPAGMEEGGAGPMSKGGLVFSGNGECIDWNPLTDDGDALRLAVKLHLHKAIAEAHRLVSNELDFYATTRLAIVRAAAALA
jgi:hypothetical protein